MFWKKMSFLIRTIEAIFETFQWKKIDGGGPVFEATVPLPRSMASSLLALPRSCHDLVMILTSVPCIMMYHDLDKGTMVNHDLARFIMIMARVPWLRALGEHGKESMLQHSLQCEAGNVDAFRTDKF